MTQIPMTVRGLEKLTETLNYLKYNLRPSIIRALVAAREHGDLKENAEYHAAREQQSFCESKIKEIEAKLSNAQVIDVTKISPSDKIIFGSTVSLKRLDKEESNIYRIVGDDEANFKNNLISIYSPIARGLIGKKTGDNVRIQTPGGTVEYNIYKVEYI